MTGKLLIKIGVFIVTLLVLPGNALAGNKEWVAVILSDNETAYEKPVQSFQDAIGVEIRLFNLQGDIRHDDGFKAHLPQDKPSLIFALGAKAAYAAKLWTRNNQDIPVLFAMVINWRKYQLIESQNNIAGISSEVNPGTQFLNLNLFAPHIKKIGVIYSPSHSHEIVKQARNATEMLGLQLIEKHVHSQKEFKKTYKKLASKVDGIWVLSDPVTYTIDNMSWLERRCVKDKIVCIGPSRNLTQIGLLLSVRPDITNIGVQAASMAKNILFRGQKPGDIGVMDPLGTLVSVNMKTADRLGITLSPKAIGMVTEIVE